MRGTGDGANMEAMPLRLLLLGNNPTDSVAVDLDSGSLRRVTWFGDVPPFATYDVVAATAVVDVDSPFPADTIGATDPVVLGRMRGRKAAKVLRPLVHPGTQPLLGAPTATVTYWTLGSTSPSVALLDPAAGPVVERDVDQHLHCRFRWRRLDHDLPLDDPSLDERLSHPTATRLSGTTLAGALGWKPERLLVRLAPPVEGRCQKVVAGLLPRP